MAPGSSGHQPRFHSVHGGNILLQEDGETALRTKSFAHGIVFSDKPLLPGELFLLEIEKNEVGWSGFCRLGLTALDPNTMNNDLPQFTVPNLVDRGQSWIFALQRGEEMVHVPPDQSAHVAYRLQHHRDDPPITQYQQDYLYTPRGRLRRSVLYPKTGGVGILAGDVGSRIGVMYLPCDRHSGYAHMHFIINGVDRLLVCDIPIYQDQSHSQLRLHVVLDVYGCTKKVRVLDPYSTDIESLEEMCRKVINLNIHSKQDVNKLPLPNKLVERIKSEAEP